MASMIRQLSASLADVLEIGQAAHSRITPCDEEAGGLFAVRLTRAQRNERGPALDALAKRMGGARRGLFNKRWELPWEAYPELRALLPDAQIDPAFAESLHRYALSRAVDGDTGLVRPELLAIDLYPFQHTAVAYLLRTRQCVLGDEAGVGKTFPSIAAACLVRTGSVIVVCPANLKLNWASEIKRARPMDSIHLCRGRIAFEPPSADWIILNYDIAQAWADTLRSVPANVVIFDELHNLKNPGAQRSQGCLQIAEGRPYRFGLTGTLFRNRHVEALFPLRVIGQLDALGGHARLLNRYCGGDESRSIDSTGFNRLLRSRCYMRREKREVMRQLPPKTRANLVVELNDRAAYQTHEAGLIQWLRGIRRDPVQWQAGRMGALARMNALRQIAGRGKVPAAIAWIESFLEESQDKLVVFAYHHVVVRALLEAFPRALHIVGEDTMPVRQDNKDRFQSDPSRRLIICSLSVASEGITLTAASTMLCLELDYVPARLFDQMEGRIDRNGQTRPTQIYYMIGENSLDQHMIRLLERKWRIVTAANTGEQLEASENVFDELVDALISASGTPLFPSDGRMISAPTR